MLATVADLEKALGLEPGSLVGGDLLRAEWCLESASDEALFYGRASWTEETVPSYVRGIVVRAAKRLYENPENATQVSENLGQYGRSVQRRAQDDLGDILTPGERKRVARAAGRAYGAFSVGTPSTLDGGGCPCDSEVSFCCGT